MRLLTYNIHKGIGGWDRQYNLQRIIEVVEGENPDIICLQEVDHNVPRSRFHNQAHLLAEHFKPAAHLQQVNVHLKTGGYGNLILSRWPFITRHQVSLRCEQRKPRGAQLVVIETPEGPLHLVHWHLGLAEEERLWQVRRLLTHPRFRDSEKLPTLIAGDFNDWRNSLAHGPFQESGFQQVTNPVSQFKSFPAYAAVGSLDKAFWRGELFVHNARIVRNALSRRASDHLPLVIDFHLEPTLLDATP